MIISEIIQKITTLPTITKVLLAGILTGMAVPPFPFGFLAWVGIIPLIQAWIDEPTPRRTALHGFIWAMGYLTVILYWVSLNSGAHWWAAGISTVVLILFLSLNTIAMGLMFGHFYRRWGMAALWLLPPIWVTVELIRSFGTLMFPWTILGNTQVDYFWLIQNTEYTGVYGISFWIVLINILVLQLSQSTKRGRPGIILALVFLIPWLSGYLLVPDVPEPTFRVGVVQPNTNATEKWRAESREKHFNDLYDLTREAALDSPNVIFWPEAATPAYLDRGRKYYLLAIMDILRTEQLQVVTGMPDYRRMPDGQIEYYNAVGHIDSTGIINRYNKIQLVPMGEYIPFSNVFTFLKSLNLGQGNFTKGKSLTLFSVDSVDFCVGVCYETTSPQLYRSFVKQGATFLSGVVNDAWFGHSSEQYQHASQFRFRAIELRRPAVRSANTGISVVYDQAGRVVAQAGVNQRAVLIADIAPSSEMTFYATFGDIFGWSNVFAVFAMMLYGLYKDRTKGADEPHQD